MKRLLTKSIVTAFVAGTVLAPTAAHAFPYNPIGIARGAGEIVGVRLDPVATATSAVDKLPLKPFATRSATPNYTGAPADVVATAHSAAGTVKGALDSLPLPVRPASAQSAVSLPGMLPTPCRIAPAVNLPVDLAQHLIAFAANRVC